MSKRNNSANEGLRLLHFKEGFYVQTVNHTCVDLIFHSRIVVHFSLIKNSRNRMDSFNRVLGMWDLDANIEVGWSEMSLS